jgi:hypothetical protein
MAFDLIAPSWRKQLVGITRVMCDMSTLVFCVSMPVAFYRSIGLYYILLTLLMATYHVGAYDLIVRYGDPYHPRSLIRPHFIQTLTDAKSFIRTR